MAENESNATERMRSLSRKRSLAIIVLIVPALVQLVTGIISNINEKRGFQSIQLPSILLLAYSGAGLCSPFIGISILRQLRAHEGASKERVERLRWLAGLAIVAPVLWLMGFVFILFATGFSR